MKTLKNLFYMLLVLAVGGFATSCSTDEVDKGPAGGIKGNGVYFAVNNPAVQYITQGQTSLTIDLSRTVDLGDYSILVLSDLSDPEIFSMDEYVNFAAGEMTASLDITIDASKVEMGQEYTFSLLLSDDDNISLYGMTRYEFTAMIDPWKDLKGDGTFVDYAFFDDPYKVKIRQHTQNPNMYRVVDPWTEALTVEGALESGLATTGYAMNFDFEVDPATGLVTWDPTPYPLNAAYVGLTAPVTMYHPGLFQDYDVTYNCQLMEGVFQIAPMILDSEHYGYIWNEQPNIIICLPGCVNIQPKMVAAEYTGTFTDPEGNTEVIFEVQTNADVATYLWSIVEGDGTDEAALNAALEAMISGEDKNAEEKLGVEALDGLELRYAMDTPGDYVAIFLPMAPNNGETIYGEPVAVPFSYSIGAGTAPADFTAEIEVTNITHNSATVSVKPVANNLKYYWGVMDKESYDKLPTTPYGSIDAYNVALFEYTANQYGMTLDEFIEAAQLISKGPDTYKFAGELEAETTYVAYAYCIDTKTLEARSAVSTTEFTTTEKPEGLTGFEAWLGEWSVTSSEGATFNIQVHASSDYENVYEVYGWSSVPLIAQFDQNGEEWPMYAAYNEDDGSMGLLSETFAYFDAAQTDAIVTLFMDSDVNVYPNYVDSGESLLQAVTTDGWSAKIDPTELSFDDGTSATIVGLEIFELDYAAGKLYILSNDQQFLTAPFSLTKTAAASTASVKKGSFDKLASARFNLEQTNARKNAKLVRRQLIEANNFVMVR